MYFIEKLIKFYNKFKKDTNDVVVADFDDNYILEDVVTCNHNFIAIDSTGQTFACSKCGFLVKKNRLKKDK